MTDVMGTTDAKPTKQVARKIRKPLPDPAPPEIPVEEDEADVPEVEEPADAEVERETGPLNLEDIDPKEHLWEGGPTVGEVLAMKAEHGDIFVTTVPYEKHFLWKTMNRAEYRMVVRRIEEISATGEMSPGEANLYQEELVCELCLLFPAMVSEDFNGELGGVPSLLSQQILESSGFVAIDTRGL